MIQNLSLGFILSSLISAGGYQRGALSKSGAIGAIFVGTLLFASGGWLWGSVLIAFFVSSSGVSFLKFTQKEKLAEKFEKGYRRDLWQVMANGSVPLSVALVHSLWPFWGWWLVFVAAIATVTADTWATELGVLSPQPPRLITTWKIVSPGTSGGVTALGTLAALLGAVFIGLVAWSLTFWLQKDAQGEPSALVVLVAAVAGVAGAMFDSWLGATRQVVYRCPTCHKETEQKRHRSCGDVLTCYVKGIPWLNNDWVNFMSSLFGALIASAMVGVLLLFQ